MLLLEQPQDVNQGNSVAGQGNWPDLWKGFKFLSPFLLTSSLLLLETVALRLWLRNKLFSLEGLLNLIVVLLAPFLALLVPVVVLFLSLHSGRRDQNRAGNAPGD